MQPLSQLLAKFGIAASVASAIALAGCDKHEEHAPHKDAKAAHDVGGSVKQAQGNRIITSPRKEAPVQNKALASLDLPVGRTETYFNDATRTVIQEHCEPPQGNQVACHTRIYGRVSQIVYDQENTYTLKRGTIVAEKSATSPGEVWSLRAHRMPYEEGKQNAKPFHWQPGSPLLSGSGNGQVQNSAIELTGKGDAVSLCSYLPVSEKRGFGICVTFDQTTQAVQSSVMTRVGNAGSLKEVLASGNRVSRPYEAAYDDEAVTVYKEKLGGGNGPVFWTR